MKLATKLIEILRTFEKSSFFSNWLTNSTKIWKGVFKIKKKWDRSSKCTYYKSKVIFTKNKGIAILSYDHCSHNLYQIF